MDAATVLVADAGLYIDAQRPADDHRGPRVALHTGVLPDVVRAGGRGDVVGIREYWDAGEGNHALEIFDIVINNFCNDGKRTFYDSG